MPRLMNRLSIEFTLEAQNALTGRAPPQSIGALDRPILLRGVEPSLNEFSATWPSQEFIALDEDATARKHHIRHARDLDTLKHGIIHSHVMCFRADGVLAIGIENYKVGVTARGNRALSRIEAKKLRRGGGDQFYNAIDAESSLANSTGVDKAHAMFNAR